MLQRGIVRTCDLLITSPGALFMKGCKQWSVNDDCTISVRPAIAIHKTKVIVRTIIVN